MLRALKAKKLENKYWINICTFFLFLSLTNILVSQDNFDERKKAALYDFNEKLFGQALDSFNAILTDLGKDLVSEKKNEIKLKIAVCHFELGQYYKATKILDEFLFYTKKPLTFQANNILPTTITWQELVNSLAHAPGAQAKSLAHLFPEDFPKQEIEPKNITAFLNKLMSSDQNCKKIIKEYLKLKEYTNILIAQIPTDETEVERQLIARYLLEALYPLNSYRLNVDEQIGEEGNTITENEKITKGHEYYEALYWRSRIDLLSSYFGFAKDGFEEALTSLNFDQINRNIECRFYKAKTKFFLKMYRIALKEMEVLNSLYGINEYYQNDFLDDAYYFMGRSLFELSLFDKAILKFKTITAGYDNREPRNSLVRNTYYWLGESYYCKDEFDNAIKSTSVILQYGAFKEKEDAHYSLGWSFFEKNDLLSRSKSKVHFQTLLKDYPNTNYRLKTELKLAEIEIEEGNASEAEKIIENLHKNKDNEAFFQKNINILKQTDFLIGLLYLKKSDFKEALSHFIKAEDTTDQKLKQKIYFQAGTCYFNLKNIKAAKAHFTIASEIPANESIKVLAQSSLADLFYQNKNNHGDLDKSIFIYSSLIAEYPNHSMNTEWRTKLANALRAKNDDDSAIEVLNKILEEDVDEWQKSQMEIGNILMESSPPRLKEAVEHFQRIIPNFKNTDLQEIANLKYGICLHQINKDVDAVQVFQHLIKSATNKDVVVDAYRYCAQSFFKEKDLVNAAKHYEESILKFPDQRNINDVRNEAVKIYRELKDYPKAIKHLNEIFNSELNLDKKADSLFQLAGYDMKLQQNNNIKNAEEKLLKIINEFKQTKIAARACFDLARLYESKEMHKEALQFYQKTIDEFTDKEIITNSSFLIGQYHYANKSYEKAIAYYEKMSLSDLNENEKDKEAKVMTMLTNKADSYFLLEKFQIAKDEYMGLIRKDSNNIFFKIRYGKSCLKSKLRIGDAISIIEKIDTDNQTKETEELLEELRKVRKEVKEN